MVGMALLSLRKLAVVSLAVIAAGCSEASGVDPEDVHDDHEEAPGEVEQGSEELISNVSCKERTDTAYVKGKASTIKLITVGGKPVSRATGHAFLKMQKAAHAAGVHLAINSGFRTMSEQQYFYDCYLSKKCNNGNLAAKPGFSNHQSGIALDMTTSSWLAKNGTKFGFVRTVPSEPWHWEYTGGVDPGGPCSTSGSGSGSGSSTATTLSWASPKNDATIGRSNAVLRVNVTNSKVEKVKFFQGSLHFATATRDSDFEVTYSFKFPGDKTLTAVGVDASGNEVPGAERNIDVTVNQLDRPTPLFPVSYTRCEENFAPVLVFGPFVLDLRQEQGSQERHLAAAAPGQNEPDRTQPTVPCDSTCTHPLRSPRSPATPGSPA
jgi:hypothetical protein